MSPLSLQILLETKQDLQARPGLSVELNQWTNGYEGQTAGSGWRLCGRRYWEIMP
jgi:hypothetical protein